MSIYNNIENVINNFSWNEQIQRNNLDVSDEFLAKITSEIARNILAAANKEDCLSQSDTLVNICYKAVEESDEMQGNNTDELIQKTSQKAKDVLSYAYKQLSKKFIEIDPNDVKTMTLLFGPKIKEIREIKDYKLSSLPKELITLIIENFKDYPTLILFRQTSKTHLKLVNQYIESKNFKPFHQLFTQLLKPEAELKEKIQLLRNLTCNESKGLKCKHPSAFDGIEEMVDLWKVINFRNIDVKQYFSDAQAHSENNEEQWNKHHNVDRDDILTTCKLKTLTNLQIASNAILPKPGRYSVKLQIHVSNLSILDYLMVTCSGSQSVRGFEGRLSLNINLDQNEETRHIVLGSVESTKSCAHAILRLTNINPFEKKEIEFDWVSYTEICDGDTPSVKTELVDYQEIKPLKIN